MRKLLLFTIFAVTFGVNAQTIQSISPNAGSSGQTLQVTVTGNGTTFSQISGTAGVSFYNSFQYFDATSYQYVSDTEIIATVTVPYFMPMGIFDAYVPTLIGEWYHLADAFSVTNTANMISGNVTVDIQGNGCDASDSHMDGIRVKLNDGTTDSFTFTNSAGNYTFLVPAGSFVVTPQPEMPYFSVSPASPAPIVFATQNNLSATQDFCISPDGVHNDLNIQMLSMVPARPGFDATYRIVYKNNGNQTLSGSINVSFDDTRLDFVSANPPLASQSLNNLSWDYTALSPFESRIIQFTLNVNSPMETPAVNIDDVLPFVATANPTSGDETPADNTANLNQVVVGSYDPNDKAVNEGSEIDLANVGEYLHYLIRFQNSGNFMAENVVVRDMLASNLDKSTLQITSVSHPYRSTLTEGNKLEFFFENINLPPENQDEPGSHGFVAFKIKPANTVGVGSVLENTAEIYFDFNFPIVTNTVSTTVTLLSTKEFDIDDYVTMYPNPAQNILHIDIKSSFQSASVKIYNQLGQLVKTADISGKINTIPVDDLKTGTYFVQIAGDNGTATKKLIKY